MKGVAKKLLRYLYFFFFFFFNVGVRASLRVP